jgi:phenylpropionate dioxygenase-like ring-hydroxylating dioxygenase large terminal subunit
VENQLDPIHLPFVHHNTIGRGNKTVVDGPRLDWLNENHFRFYVRNRADDGTPPLKPMELAIDDSQVHLDFKFPNLWQNWISQKFRIVAAFAPVDEANTVIYLHTYQSMAPWPVARQLFDVLAQRLNRLILNQDRRVVITQRPKRSELRLNEMLIEGDRPIVAYRTRRQALLTQGNRQGEQPAQFSSPSRPT